jgi:hypothetical protein
MAIQVDLSELVTALEFASMRELGADAFIDLDTGKIYLTSEEIDDDDDVPENMAESERFLGVPGRRELDLGRDQLFDFVERHLPDDYDTVAGYFHKKGAFRRTKDLLAARGLLEAWHRFEEHADEEALREWCERRGIEVVDARAAPAPAPATPRA